MIKPYYLLVGLPKQTLQAEQHSTDIVHCTPLVLKNVEADTTTEVDVGVVDGCLKEDGGRCVGVCGAELHAQLEDEGLVGRGGRAVDGSGPAGHVLVVRKGCDALGGLHHNVHELLL